MEEITISNINPHSLNRIPVLPPKDEIEYFTKKYGKPYYMNKKLPDKKGIYFIFNNKDKIIYIGQTRDIRGRVRTHSSYQTSMFYEESSKLYVSYILIEEDYKRKFFEKFYIYYYDPFYNCNNYQKTRNFVMPKDVNMWNINSLKGKIPQDEYNKFEDEIYSRFEKK